MILSAETLTKKPLTKTTPSSMSTHEPKPLGFLSFSKTLNSLLFVSTAVKLPSASTVTSCNSSLGVNVNSLFVPVTSYLRKRVSSSSDVFADDLTTFVTTPEVFPCKYLPWKDSL